MYQLIAWLSALLGSRKLCPNWPRVPTALAVAVLVVTGFALTVVLGSAPVHQGVSASISIAWGK